MPDPSDRTLPPITTLPLEPGATLGSFRLVSLLGEGGMGRVFVAEDTRLGRKVALKVMLPHLARDERARKMFLREARSAAAVGHDRIVAIHEANEAAGVPYIAMELLAGEPLNEFLNRTPCPPLPVALTIAYQVAEGLHAAHTHEQHLIHRDIKPANVWLRSKPGWKGIDVRLLDFGLARAAAGDSISVDGISKAGGTPQYMAPEQWDGMEVDHQSDLFSLGVMLYQMLTGVSPFNGDSVKVLMFQICMPTTLPASPMSVNPAIPADVSAFVLRMLAKDKTQRVATADEAMRALAKFRKAAMGGSTAIPVAKSLPPVPPAAKPASRADTKPLLPDDHLTTAPARRPVRRPVRRPKPSRRPAKTVWLIAGGVGLVGAVVVAMLVGTSSGRPTGKGETGGGVVQPTTPKTSPPPTERKADIPNTPPPAKVRPSLLDCTGPTGASEAVVKAAQLQWSDYLGVPVEYRVDLGGGVGMDFVLVPPGKFLIGTTEAELDALVKLFPKMTKSRYTDEMPQHAVTITKPMYVGKTEVTRGQFARFAASGYETEAERTNGGWGWDAVKKKLEGRSKKYSWKETGWPADDTHPVVNFTWNDAKAFTEWVRGRPLPNGFREPRLPTEAEWEYVCRGGGTRSRYPNGSDEPESLALIANVSDASVKKLFPTWDAIAADDRHSFTAPAAFYAANRFGLFDMIGNVWEWCEDGYEPEAYKSNDESDPYIKPSKDTRVLRGGSWYLYPWTTRPAGRLKNDAFNLSNNVGCRLLLPQDSD